MVYPPSPICQQMSAFPWPHLPPSTAITAFAPPPLYGLVGFVRIFNTTIYFNELFKEKKNTVSIKNQYVKMSLIKTYTFSNL